MVRSLDGYYALCEYQAKADAVEAKARLHHSRFVQSILRKEHATGYWADKAATGLKIDSVSRPKALECLAQLGFSDAGGYSGWDSVLRKPERAPRLRDVYKEVMARIYQTEDGDKDNGTPKDAERRRRRAHLGLPDYDSFDEDFDLPVADVSNKETRSSQIRSQLGIPDYDSFDEDF